MIWIFEGVDGVGKTSAVKKLNELFLNHDMIELKLMKCVGPDKDGNIEGKHSFNYFYDKLIEAQDFEIKVYQANKYPIVIFDRFFQSNLVYNAVYDNQKELMQHHLIQLMLKMASMRYAIIHFDVHDDEIEKFYNLQQNEAAHKTVEDYLQIVMEYRNMLEMYGKFYNTYMSIKVNYSIEHYKQNLNTLCVNIRNSMINELHAFSNDEACKNIISFLKEYKELEYIGRSNFVAFIGEKVNSNNNCGYIDPFIGGCGKALFTELMNTTTLDDTYKLLLNELYFTNAIKTNGKEISYNELSTFKILIVFGINANKIIEKVIRNNKDKPIIITVKHPAYVKRFESIKFHRYFLGLFMKTFEKMEENMSIQYSSVEEKIRPKNA